MVAIARRTRREQPREGKPSSSRSRLTPHPFSASNYLFGLTKLRLTPYVLGTAVGLVPWVGLYAVSGAYGRKLLDSGEAFDEVLADVSAVVRGDIEIAEEAALAVAVALAVVWGCAEIVAGKRGGGDERYVRRKRSREGQEWKTRERRETKLV